MSAWFSRRYCENRKAWIFDRWDAINVYWYVLARYKDWGCLLIAVISLCFWEWTYICMLYFMLLLTLVLFFLSWRFRLSCWPTCVISDLFIELMLTLTKCFLFHFLQISICWRLLNLCGKTHLNFELSLWTLTCIEGQSRCSFCPVWYVLLQFLTWTLILACHFICYFFIWGIKCCYCCLCRDDCQLQSVEIIWFAIKPIVLISIKRYIQQWHLWN